MHQHGSVYRARIASAGNSEYSDWFNTEEALRDAMRGVKRDDTKTYICEMKRVRCNLLDCDAEETITTIGPL